MAERIIDRESWPRARVFELFRGYARPHYTLCTRIDVTHLMSRKDAGIRPYHGCLFALGAGLHAVPEMRQRFRREAVVEHDSIALSITVPDGAGGFVFADLDWQEDYRAFEKAAQAQIIDALARDTLGANDGAARDDVAYLSCLPWLDFTALDNALPGPEDCIPRLSWGKFVTSGQRIDMALAMQVHHALVDGAHLGAFVAAAQEALDRL
jgi:chloramphenicol O-acetyltransferase type A